MASSAIGIAAALLMGNIVLAGVCLLGLLIKYVRLFSNPPTMTETILNLIA